MLTLFGSIGRRGVNFIAAFIACLASPPAPAQPLSLVRDIVTQPAAWQLPNFTGLVATPDDLYFSSEKWIYRSDGTSAGTVVLNEIADSSQNTSAVLRAVGNGVFFSNASRFDSWANIDDSPQSTRALPSAHAQISDATSALGLVFYRTRGSTGGVLPGVWRTDGTPAGTYKLGDFSLETGTFIQLGSSVLFHDVSPEGELGIYSSDGTVSGTRFLGPRVVTFDPANTALLNGFLYFSSGDPAFGFEVWRTDGTPEGTARVTDINPGPASSSPYWFAATDAAIFFFANDGVHGAELWTSDGTPEGARLVRDIVPGPNSSMAPGSPIDGRIAVFNNRVFFTAAFPDVGTEIGVSDGTEEGTSLLFDVAPASASSNINNLTPVGDQLFFTAITPANGRELWRTDGTPLGTRLVADLRAGPNPAFTENIIPPVAFRNRLYFWALLSAPSAGNYLCSSDGTALGTGRMFPIAPPDATSGSNPTFVTSYNGDLIFELENLVALNGIWRTNGTDAGTSRISPLLSRAAGSLPNNQFVFTADSGATPGEPWRSNATTAGTALLLDINPGASGSSAASYLPLRTRTIFYAVNSSSGRALWSTDGTTAGTQLLYAAVPQSPTPIYSAARLDDDLAVFYTRTALFRTDASPEGTTQIFNFAPLLLAPGGEFARAGGKLFFRVSSTIPGLNPDRLWVTDGTTAGTHEVSPNAPRVLELGAELDHDLIYAGFDPTVGPDALVRTDGTAEGTHLIKDLNPLEFSGLVANFVRAGSHVFFTFSTRELGQELWVTDGTEEGTRPVKDIFPGMGSSFPRRLLSWRNRVYFVANSPEAGEELWVSDGTEEGTRMVQDLWTGPRGSDIRMIASAGNALYITASSILNGLELWTLRLTSVDFDASGSIDSADFFAFLQLWISESDEADYDGSGAVTSADLFLFLQDFFQSP